jgi:RNA polymerase sigma-70 factor (ECF subfamily)
MTILELRTPAMEPSPRLNPPRPEPGPAPIDRPIEIVAPGTGDTDDLAARFGAGADDRPGAPATDGTGTPAPPVVLHPPALHVAEPADVHVAEAEARSEAAVPLGATAEAAFEELYRAEARAITNLIHSLTGRRDIAEEIVQDAFVVTHDRWRRVSQYDRPADFVRRVALNRALSSLRRRKTEHRALERWQHRSPLVTEDRGPRDEALWQAVRRLPARQQRAVALMYVEDQPIARVAEILGCSENTVKTHLKRARATLATALGDQREGRPTGTGGGRHG